MKNNQKGFGAIEALLIIVLAGIIGFTGWYVYNANHKVSDNLSPNKSKVTVVHKKTVASDPTSAWKPYTDNMGKFSIKYPKTWVTPTNPDDCANTAAIGLFMLGANASSVGKCATEDSGQMAISWQSDNLTCGDDSDDITTLDSKQTVMIDGHSGTKIETTAKDPGNSLGANPEGTKSVRYCVVANNVKYTAGYRQLASYPDSVKDFNLMITKTLKFN